MGLDLGDCAVDEQGSWPGALNVTQCISRCAQCARCNYLSMRLSHPSLADEESKLRAKRMHAPAWWRCRWYHACDMDDLRQTPASSRGGYITIKAMQTSTTESRAPVAIIAKQGDLGGGGVETALGGSLGVGEGRGVGGGVEGGGGVKLALVTVATNAPRLKFGYSVKCALLQWCQSARRLQRVLPASWRVRRLVIGSLKEASWLNSSAGCQLQLIEPERELLDAAQACATRLATSSRAFIAAEGRVSGYVHDSTMFKQLNNLKLHLLALAAYDVVCFADADVELMPYAEGSVAATSRAWVRVITNLLQDASVALLGNPDGQSPLNTGVMLLKPNATLFADGVGVLRRCQFNRTHGWDHVGRPSSLRVEPMLLRAHVGAANVGTVGAMRLHEARRWLQRTKAYRHDFWDFTSADCDQGLFFYLLFVRHRVGAFGAHRGGPARRMPSTDDRGAAGGPRMPPARVMTRHWWASFKPWREWPLGNRGGGRSVAEYLHSLTNAPKYYGPAFVAKLYGYVLGAEEPEVDSSLGLLRASTCWQGQRALRKAIEAAPHFGEVFRLLEQKPQQCGGAWLPLPS